MAPAAVIDVWSILQVWQRSRLDAWSTHVASFCFVR